MTNDDLREAIGEMLGKIKQASDEFDDLVTEASRKGYVGDLYRTDYTVTGRGAFPMDMLRYAVSWPHDESDASNITYSQDDDNDTETYVIRLSKYHRDAMPQLCDERWEQKFRWKVLRNNTIETVKI